MVTPRRTLAPLSPRELLEHLQAIGARVWTDGVWLYVAPASLLASPLGAMLTEQAPGLVRLFRPPPVVSAAVADRVREFERVIATWTASRRHAPPALRLPGARPGGAGTCAFCGDLAPRGWRCDVCRQALEVVCHMEREQP